MSSNTTATATTATATTASVTTTVDSTGPATPPNLPLSTVVDDGNGRPDTNVTPQTMQMLHLARKLGIDTSEPQQLFGFFLGCASSSTYARKSKVRPSIIDSLVLITPVVGLTLCCCVLSTTKPLVFYMVPYSPRSCIVWVLLEHMGLSYETSSAFESTPNEMRHPSYSFRFPHHCVPAIQLGDTVSTTKVSWTPQ